MSSLIDLIAALNTKLRREIARVREDVPCAFSIIDGGGVLLDADAPVIFGGQPDTAEWYTVIDGGRT